MKLHKNFQCNGRFFAAADELINFSLGISDEVYLFLKDWFSDAAFMDVKTSGSTGTPKTIQLSKELMVNSALATGKALALREDTSALLCLPVQYIAGKMMLVRAMVLGWHIDLIEANANPLEKVFKEYDFCAMVPLQLENSLPKINLIKKLIVGGGVVSNQLQEQLQTIATDVFATYGMTETITHVALKKLNHFLSLRGGTSRRSVNHKTKADSLVPSNDEFYTVLPNIKIYKDTRNCLVIDAPKVSNEIIFTNDVVDLISDKHFTWLGRFDNVINSGGVKLHPEKIEVKLSKIIEKRFFVAGVPDDSLGEKLVLLVEFESSKLSKFKSFISEKIKNLATLSKFEVPKEIYFVDAFVETETKKIQRSKTLDLVKFL